MLRKDMRRVLRSLAPMLALTVVLTLVTAVVPARAAEDPPYVTLAGRAVLPADTFAAGPPSGSAIEGSPNGRATPFASQPVQGISAVIPKWNGNWLAMSDNGFGSKANSPDYRLRWYEVDVDFGNGNVDVVGFTELSDPDGQIPFPIANTWGDRVLSGADFDLESFRQVPDGSFWFGEEFGPYLIHTDAEGRLIDAPIDTPVPPQLAAFARGASTVKSPDHPDFVDLADDDARFAAANHPRSRGFEGMALNASGTRLYPLLEGAMIDDPIRTRLILFEFDLETKAYTGNVWFYNLSSPGHAIGEMTAISDNEFLVIERDGGQGEDAEYKKIYKIDLLQGDSQGFLDKELVADLMAITDIDGITEPEEGAIGLGDIFTFPFVTIESVYPVDSRTLLVINDNNFPFSTGRRAAAPDDNEFILIRLADDL